MPRGIYKREKWSAAQMQRTINGLEAQLSHAQTSLESAVHQRDEAVQGRNEYAAQRDQATARAAEFEQHNGRLFSQVVALRRELDMDKKAMEQGVGLMNEGSERLSALKSELTAMERALAIVSGVRATG